MVMAHRRRLRPAAALVASAVTAVWKGLRFNLLWGLFRRWPGTQGPAGIAGQLLGTRRHRGQHARREPGQRRPGRAGPA